MVSYSHRMHMRLYRIIGDEMPTSSQTFNDFKHAIPLSARDKYNNDESAENLLSIWEARGGFYLGNYSNLVKLLLEARLIGILHLVKRHIDRIEEQIQIEQAERNSTAEEALSPPNDYQSSDDSPTKDHLKLIQFELKSWYLEIVRRVRPIQESAVELHLDDIYTNFGIVPGIKHQLSQGTRCHKNPTLRSIFNTDTSERSVCFIEGPAGMGKSTLCKHLVYLWSLNGFSVVGHSFDLIFLLEAQALRGDLEKCIKDHIFPKDFALSEDKIYECLRNHQEKCVLIIDGVDELTPEGKITVMELLNGTKLRRVNLVLTGRLEASMEFVNLVKLHLKLEGFSVKNLQGYIGKHLNSVDNKLMKRVKTDATLREIMTNPLIASLVCLLVEDNEGEIPEKSIEIQNEVLHVICKNYVIKNEAGGCVDLTEEELFSAACHFAYSGLKQGIVRYPKQTLESNCRDGLSEHLLKSGLLTKGITLSRLHTEDFCSFPHKSFQEVLCANYLAELSEDELKTELVPSSNFMLSERSMIFMLIEMLQCENKIGVVYESLKKLAADKWVTPLSVKTLIITLSVAIAIAALSVIMLH